MNQDGGRFPVRRSGTTRWRRSLVHGIIGLAAALAACDGPVPDQGESERTVRLPEVVDSAGIRIVTNFEPQWNEGEEWVVEVEPHIVLGEGSDELSPYLWQVKGAAVLSSGNVAALVGGRTAPGIVILSPEGELVRVIGRAGQGPGEFTEPLHFQRIPGDTLEVWERYIGRITSFDTLGSVVSTRVPDRSRATAPMQAGGTGRRVALPLPDGSFVGTGDLPPIPLQDLSPGDTVQNSMIFVRIHPDYSADTLGVYPWTQRVIERDSDGRVTESSPFISRAALAGAGGDPLRIVVGTGHPLEGYHVFDEASRLVQIVRSRAPELPFSAADRDEMVDELLIVSQLPQEHVEGIRRSQRNAAFPSTFPSFVGAWVDPLGYVWILDWRTGRYLIMSVFDPEGAWLGRVRLPFAEIREIGEDYILGWTYDSNFIESLQVHRLRRGGGEAAAR